jgi:hypothetical protein
MYIFSSGKPQGVGILERGVYGEGDGNGEISLRATWDQGGQDSITARRVPSKYRETKGGQRGMRKGKAESKGITL